MIIPQKINLTIILGKIIKKSVKIELHKIKQTNHRQVFKETIKVEVTRKKLSLNLTFISYSVKEIAQDSQVNMNLSMLKLWKSIIFNLSTKKYKIFIEKFFSKALFFTGGHFLYRGYFFAHHCNLINSKSNENLNNFSELISSRFYYMSNNRYVWDSQFNGLNK